VATNLAAVSPLRTCYADCDVEEPNGHIFLEPTIRRKTLVTTPVPRVKAESCDLCGICSDVCRFNAIAVHSKGVEIFDELCHGCGGCTIACPMNAIWEKPREIGVVRVGASGHAQFIDGKLNIGEAVVPPLVKAVKKEIPEAELVLIDAPPGTSCPVIAAVSDADYCLLVTEPTPFGLNDLTLAVGMVRELGVPFGVAINRHGIGNADTEEYCKAEKIPVLIKIPDDRRIAEAYSRGRLVVEEVPGMRSEFLRLLTAITGEVQSARRRAARVAGGRVGSSAEEGGSTGQDGPTAQKAPTEEARSAGEGRSRGD